MTKINLFNQINKSTHLVIIVLLVIQYTSVFAQYGGGNGDPNSPYLIYNPTQMNAIGADPNDWNKSFKLMTNIDLAQYSGTQFNKIGTSSSLPFSGVFDGNGHSITNFNYVVTSSTNIGLFGYVKGINAEIKNIQLVDPNILAISTEFSGSLIGLLRDGTVDNCNIIGGKVSGVDWVGGMIGLSYNGKISNCSSSALVTGEGAVGGLIGMCDQSGEHLFENCSSTGDVIGNHTIGGLTGFSNSNITNCYSTGNITGHTHSVGGLVGYYDNNFNKIINSYSTGNISGTNNIGGLIGLLEHGNIDSCYSTSNINGMNSIGGLVGQNQVGTISNSYSISNISGNQYVGGIIGFQNESSSNCYHKGTVTGNTSVGGLFGAVAGAITNCYSSTTVSGNTETGAICGKDLSGTYNAIFWDNQINSALTGFGNISDPNEVIGISTQAMLISHNFIDAGWDFTNESNNGTDDIWRLCTDGTSTPRFAWEFLEGDFNCPDGVNIIDFSILESKWLLTNCNESNNFCMGTDINHSGIVDSVDYFLFLENWLIN